MIGDVGLDRPTVIALRLREASRIEQGLGLAPDRLVVVELRSGRA